MGPFSQPGLMSFMVLLSIVMIIVQIILGDVPAWILWTNWGLAGIASYVLWDCVDRYRLGRSVKRASMFVPWIILASMANYCSTCFSVRMMGLENYLAIICFLLLIRQGMSLWQKTHAVQTLVWQGLLIGAASAVYPGMLLWMLIVPVQHFFMRCSSVKNFFMVFSGVLLGIWCAYCVLFFWGIEGSLDRLFGRYHDLLVVEWDLSLTSSWQWLAVGVVVGMTVLYCMFTLLLSVSNTLRAQSINRLLCVCQIMVLMFTFLDMEHLPISLLLQTMLLGLQLIVILANSRTYLPEWWTLLIVASYMALSVAPYLPQEWINYIIG